MSSSQNSQTKYPLLSEFLTLQQVSLKATYTVSEVATLFHVSPRAIQNRVASGQLSARDLPGRARFLSEDLEAFLSSSKRKVERRGR